MSPAADGDQRSPRSGSSLRRSRVFPAPTNPTAANPALLRPRALSGVSFLNSRSFVTFCPRPQRLTTRQQEVFYFNKIVMRPGELQL